MKLLNREKLAEMLKKSLVTITTIVLALAGLFVPQSASAAPVFSPKATIANNSVRGAHAVLDDNRMLSVWFDQDDNGSYLRSAILKSDGTWGSTAAVVTKSRDFTFIEPTDRGITVAPDGTIALAWSEIQFGNQGQLGSSRVYVSYSQDGLEWSAPMLVIGPKSLPDSFMCAMERECGFGQPNLTMDRFGTLGLIVPDGDYNAGFELLASSTRDGANWASTVVLDTSTSPMGSVELQPSPQGGFLAMWGAYSDNWYLKYSTMSGTILNFWKVSKSLGLYDSLGQMKLAQTDPSHFSAFVFTQTNSIPIFHQRVFNVTTGLWGVDSPLHTFSAGWPDGDIQFATGKNGHSVVGFSAVGNGVQHGEAFLIELVNSVPQTPKNIITTDTEQSMKVDTLHINADDSTTVVVSGLNAIPRLLTVKNGEVAETTNVPVTGTNQIWAAEVHSSPNGNVFMLFGEQIGYEGMVYLGATAPVPTSVLRLSGVAAVGKQLSGLIPTFGGVSSVGVNTIQWYACATAVTAPQTSIPAGCVAIAKATAAKFKVSAKQKKKFLGVAVTNQNSIGTTTLFSATTKKVK